MILEELFHLQLPFADCRGQHAREFVAALNHGTTTCGLQFLNNAARRAISIADEVGGSQYIKHRRRNRRVLLRENNAKTAAALEHVRHERENRHQHTATSTTAIAA